VIIIIGGSGGDHEQVFADVQWATTYTCDCMPFENNKSIWIGRGLALDINELWPELKHFD